MKKGDPCEQKGIFAGNEFCEIWTKLHGWFGWCVAPEKRVCFSKFWVILLNPHNGPKNWSEPMVQRTKKIRVPGFFLFFRPHFFLQGPPKRFNGTNTFEFRLASLGSKVWPRCKNLRVGTSWKSDGYTSLRSYHASWNSWKFKSQENSGGWSKSF